MNTRDELIQNVVSTMRNQTKKMQLSVIPTLKSYIPLNEFLALHLLYKEGNHIVSEIAEHMHISNSSMTCISDRLMEREFVTRVRSQKDRRVVYLSITDKGKAFAEEMEKSTH
ncbi:transcriptional regulator [Priestia megaterium WSH-002]|uniref:Transcriptional regulator n=1 Tax=Priestia megaterium (strain WSH-002) TaxID=1006007 RepID=A0A8D3WX92_PRIMW|nr:MarR family transcriptional regulator [Priestia megaterium]AEN88507.1 transcriptional regulator [Priestia megaterium WSH-002]